MDKDLPPLDGVRTSLTQYFEIILQLAAQYDIKIHSSQDRHTSRSPNSHYLVASKHSFVLFVIPGYILRQKKCKIDFTILDNMERRQMGFNHRF